MSKKAKKDRFVCPWVARVPKNTWVYGVWFGEERVIVTANTPVTTKDGFRLEVDEDGEIHVYRPETHEGMVEGATLGQPSYWIPIHPTPEVSL